MIRKMVIIKPKSEYCFLLDVKPSKAFRKNKSGQTGIETDLSALVERTGIEPVIPP